MMMVMMKKKRKMIMIMIIILNAGNIHRSYWSHIFIFTGGNLEREKMNNCKILTFFQTGGDIHSQSYT